MVKGRREAAHDVARAGLEGGSIKKRWTNECVLEYGMKRNASGGGLRKIFPHKRRKSGPNTREA